MAGRPRVAAGERAVESPAVARLPGGDLPYTLRRSPRATRLRVTIHPERGVVVTIPIAARRGWVRPDAVIATFLAEREPWVRRHLARQAATRTRLDGRLPLDEGRLVPYRGVPHRVRVEAAPKGTLRSRVSRVGGDEGDELLVERSARDHRPTAAILESWFRERARADLDGALSRHAPALGVTPTTVTIRDTTTRWGSCSRRGGLSFSWRLVLAPPEALEAVAAHEVCHLRVFGHSQQFWALLGTRVPDHVTWRRWLRRHAPELHAALDD
ncbi:MAG TPA: SprT family zinc-dependent metalloprotease [Candidatus Limnocylindrales bacterium]|nr:SprT family zinc-dependent metalloprotease [Candidatus Limnocylindrales bacterium]